jgi:hypothetical protein
MQPPVCNAAMADVTDKMIVSRVDNDVAEVTWPLEALDMLLFTVLHDPSIRIRKVAMQLIGKTMVGTLH